MDLTILLIIFIVLFYFLSNKQLCDFFRNEHFSDSGLNMSNRYCNKIANVYRHPNFSADKFVPMICDIKRRHEIKTFGGNYHTINNLLV